MSSGGPQRKATNHPASATSPADEQTLENVRRQLAAAVRRICPPWLSAQRDDITQTALIRVYNLAGENREGFSASYLWKVAFSVTMDEIRRQRRRPEDSLEAAVGTDVIQASPGPEARALGRELGRIIRECLTELGEDRRLAVTLHLQGHSIAEASTLLDWPNKRVANLTYRGLEDLRRNLSARGIEL
jgi:RNA polymerase sigma-70 factor (ECF subfamily)